MSSKKLHTARLLIALPPSLLEMAKKIAHREEISLACYIRGLILADLGNADFDKAVHASGQLDLPIVLPPRCVPCRVCGGSGRVDGDKCYECLGSCFQVPDHCF